MNDRDTVLSRSKDAKLLNTRIAENVSAQEIDLVEWIFNRIAVKRGSCALELCCGTGAQTLKLLDLIGDTGHIIALDTSREALNTLVSKADPAKLSRLTTVEANIDELGLALAKAGLESTSFVLVFCAYGLYYSGAAEQVLQEAKQRLKPDGEIVVVGPFGPNNRPLFQILQQCGVNIPPFVTYSSQNFMYDEVIPWATENFQSLAINTMVNRIRWASPQSILNYWRNSTFFQEEKLAVVEDRVNRFFESHSEFINEKWVMMVEMSHAR